MSLRSKLSRLSVPEPEAEPEVAPIAPPASNTLDQLRAKMNAILERSGMEKRPAPRAVDTDDLPFASIETDSGLLHVRNFRLSPAHRTGRAPLLPARDASTELLALLALDPSLQACQLGGALYLDTETTGLSGGTGTVAFLVGLAFWEGGDFVVEQLLVRELGEEAPMLERVAMRLQKATMIVTFNGKAFDMPLLRTRFVMNRIAPPENLPHLDLLHVARRLHRPRGITCRLTNIEREILGFERDNDVDSADVSACYFHFLRTGDGSALRRVVEHNSWDVVSMAALVGLYGEPLEGSQLDPEDLVGVARTLKRAGAMDGAAAAAETAIRRGAGHESIRVRAEIAKARGDRARALLDYSALAEKIDCDRVRLELAKLYEHYVKEPARALALVEQGTGESEPSRRHRAARLTRKARDQGLGVRDKGRGTASLFRDRP
ncbi:ribonuclease H-like domain-containing protein [Pendulispora rubella]|uniref:Ribonuclease H-like domain-containing protein n=1 Tax=Pendulispora rubella TaxID=2741070 RepID=A0ABZ2LEC9_9BACT